MPLTELSIKNALPKDKEYKISDKDGLYLLVRISGSKFFKYDYRFNGVKKECAIGKYPEMSLKEAREKLIEVKKLLSAGINPNEAKKLQLPTATDEENTLKKVAAEWFEKNKAQWTPSYAEDKWHKLERDIFPYIADRPIKSITAQEFLAIIRKIEARGSIETAHRTSNIVGEIFIYAISSGIADRNITTDIRGALSKKPPVKHMATITDTKEVGALLRALEGYQGLAIVRAALMLSPYVMLRPIEVASAEWAEIDLEKKIWKIPAEKMKKRRIHIVPLSEQVITILKSLQPLGGKYVFPSIRTPTRHMSAPAINAALRRMGYTGEEMTAHGFRSMASTLLYENGFSEDIVEMQLAHAEDNKIKAVYNHAQHLQRRADMMQWWADYLDGLKNGSGLN